MIGSIVLAVRKELHPAWTDTKAVLIAGLAAIAALAMNRSRRGREPKNKSGFRSVSDPSDERDSQLVVDATIYLNRVPGSGDRHALAFADTIPPEMGDRPMNGRLSISDAGLEWRRRHPSKLESASLRLPWSLIRSCETTDVFGRARTTVLLSIETPLGGIDFQVPFIEKESLQNKLSEHGFRTAL